MSYKSQGVPVNITFSSADATTIAALSLEDCNGVAVTLGSNEGLLIDSLSCFTALTGTNRAEIFHDADAGSDVDPNELIAAFGVGNGGIGFPGEGYACKVGLTPKIKATAAGQINVTGVGRITKRQSEGVRMSWECSTVPGH